MLTPSLPKTLSKAAYTPASELLYVSECTPEYRFLWRSAEAFLIEDYPYWAFDKEHQWYALATKREAGIRKSFAVQLPGEEGSPINTLLDMGSSVLVDDGTGPVTDYLRARQVVLHTALLKYTPGAKVRFWQHPGDKGTHTDLTHLRRVFEMTDSGLKRSR